MLNPEVVQRALRAIKRGADAEFFFNELDSPAWLQPLRQAGLFNSPPPPVAEGEYVRFPSWPQSRYLVRMAGKAPKAVLEVIDAIPDTENIRIHEDLLEAALVMPPNEAASLVPRVSQWLGGRFRLLVPDRAGELIARLATGGR